MTDFDLTVSFLCISILMCCALTRSTTIYIVRKLKITMRKRSSGWSLLLCFSFFFFFGLVKPPTALAEHAFLFCIFCTHSHTQSARKDTYANSLVETTQRELIISIRNNYSLSRTRYAARCSHSLHFTVCASAPRNNNTKIRKEKQFTFFGWLIFFVDSVVVVIAFNAVVVLLVS